MKPIVYSDIVHIVATNSVNHIEVVYLYSVVMYVQMADGRVGKLQFTRIDKEENIENSEFEKLEVLRGSDFNLRGILETIITNKQFNVVSVASYFYPEKDAAEK